MTQDAQDGLADEFDRVRAIKEAYTPELMAKANVIGVGVGLRTRQGAQTKEVALVVLVTEKVPPSRLDASDVVPKLIEGVPVDVQEVGELKPQR